MRYSTGKRLLAATCAAICAAASGCAVNPVTGDRQFMIVGAGQEVALGDDAHPNIIHMYNGEYRDPELNSYLGTIVMRLHKVSHRPEVPMEFTMLNTSLVNAFATPAHVYATRGFLARLDNEAQFAAVMGHELTHVAARHSAKAMSDSLLTGLVVTVGESALGDSGAGQWIVGAGAVGIQLLGLHYSRQQEHQADRVGTYYMALAGWDPRQSIDMQKILGSLKTHQPTALDKYLSTHPPTDERIADVRAVIDEKGLLAGRYVQGDGVYAERWRRRTARLRQVSRAYEPYDEGLKRLAAKDYQGALRAAEQALAIRADQAPFLQLKGEALIGLKRPDQARSAFQFALERDRRYVRANIGLARVAAASNDLSAAERQFAVAAHGWPGSAQAWYGLGLVRYKMARYAEAVGPLEKLTGALGKDPDFLYTLAVCYDKTGQHRNAYNAYRQAIEVGLSGAAKSQAAERVQYLQAALNLPNEDAPGDKG